MNESAPNALTDSMPWRRAFLGDGARALSEALAASIPLEDLAGANDDGDAPEARPTFCRHSNRTFIRGG